MMGHRERLTNHDEWSAFSSWRQVTIWNHGELRLVKRRMNKRIRARAKVELRVWRESDGTGD
jgi:hypothetical protein